ncbi:MAG: GDP-mannose 4,6-dehydratase [Acidimicrobiia bacterium]
MLALVTGAGGFVGRHLVEHLVAAGDTVVGSDRAPAGDHLALDVTDAGQVDEAIGAVQPDAVYHLAGWSDVGGSWDAPREVLRANVEGTHNVLLACALHGVGRVLSVSSADIYGAVTEAELPVTEVAPLRPVSPYAVSKVAADFLGLQAFLGHGLDVVRARSFNHLGPGQSNRFVAAALAERVARAERAGGGEIPVGNLSARRDVTDVRDVVRAYRLLVENGVGGEAYNVCSGRAVAVQELAERLVGLAGTPLRLRAEPSLLRPVDVPVLQGDPGKLRAVTGWSPRVPLATTLADLLADARSRT